MSMTATEQRTYTYHSQAFSMTCDARLNVLTFNGNENNEYYDATRRAMLRGVAELIEDDKTAPDVIWCLTVDVGGERTSWYFDLPSQILAARDIVDQRNMTARIDIAQSVPSDDFMTSADEFRAWVEGKH